MSDNLFYTYNNIIHTFENGLFVNLFVHLLVKLRYEFLNVYHFFSLEIIFPIHFPKTYGKFSSQ